MLVGEEGQDTNGMVAAIIEKEKKQYKGAGLIAAGKCVIRRSKDEY